MTVERYEPTSLLIPATDSWVAVVRDVSTLAAQICDTDFVPESLRWRDGEPDFGPAAARVTAVILHGRELGLPPMTALALTHLIKGKPSIAAEAMRSLVLQAGHEIQFVETTGARCIIKGRRQGVKDWTTVEWTLEDVRRARINNQTYTNYPRQMLAARATAELCRMIFADAIHGMKAVEELDDIDTPQPSEPQRPAPIEQPGIVRRQPRKPAPAATETAPEPPAEQAAPIARKRPPIRRRTPQDSGENLPPDATPKVAKPDTTTPVPGTAGAEPPSAPATPTEPYDNPPPLSSQVAAIHMHATRLGIGDEENRDYRLTVIAHLAGIDTQIGGSADLTKTQAIKVIRQLEKLRDRDALEAHLNQDTLERM